MLKDKDVSATIAVKDIERAKKFYHDVVGLTPLPSDEDGVQSFKTGTGSILVYKSDFAGTNRATAATWNWTTSSMIPSSRSSRRASRSSTTTCRA